MRHPEVIDFLRGEQLTVVEVNGWQTRGNATFAPFASLEHDTGVNAAGCAPSLGTILNGRGTPGTHDYLPPPLAHTLQSRCADDNGLDVVYLVACGRANHAGEGFWLGADSNVDLWGNEVEHRGTTDEPLDDMRFETSVRIHTAFARCSSFDAGMVAMHREYALPHGRKPDVPEAIMSAARLRAAVARRLAGPITTEDDDMAIIPSWVSPQNGRWPSVDLVDVSDSGCLVLVAAGIGLKPGLDKIASPHFAYGGAAWGAASTLRVTGMNGRPKLAVAPNGDVVLVTAGALSTYAISSKP